jgi:mono/diheme cytochrome c family protein
MSSIHPLAFLSSVLLCATSALFAEPILPALANCELEPQLKGEILIEELNCVACHQGEASLAKRSKQAPWLAEVGSRVNPAYLESFISDPHGVKPGTTMPHVMSHQTPAERSQAATEITHFLLSQKDNGFAPEAPDAVAARAGKELFQERGCAACHSPRDDRGVELITKNSVPLGVLDKKYSLKSLMNFLENPHASRPSGRMPNMQLPAKEIANIAHYLLQDTRVPGHLGYTLYEGEVFEGIKSENVKAVKAGLVNDFALASVPGVHHQSAIKYNGWINLAQAGSYTFFLEMNGGSLIIDDKSIVQEEPSNRRHIKQLEATADLAAGWRKIELTYVHTGFEPKFTFEMAGPGFPRGAIPSSMLSISNEPILPFTPLKVDATLAAAGQQKFASMGCASCHTDVKAPVKLSKSMASLGASSGCLSKTPGPWPQYDLTDEQREWITLALPHMAEPQTDPKKTINKSLVALNCIACHERTGLGGIAPERDPLFTGTQPSLGDQGRIPPPLSHVGAKLQTPWIADAMLHGKRQRTYLNASMPQYGEANVGHLVELFEKVDSLETAVMPQVSSMKESKEAGYNMVGTEGLSCIACHQFDGLKSGGMGALDLTYMTQRLKKNWFNLYMLQPSRFHPTVTMPSYWPAGVSTRPNILGGDSAQQIEAIWSYLADGKRAKKPLGLSRESNVIRVSDTTELCRGQGPAGYRGIAVGYPGSLNLAFDSEEMAVRQLWKGDFVSVDFGSFKPQGKEAIAFPGGIPFHRLKSLEDNWPYKGKTNYTFPQDQGYKFHGYRLDAARRPTFRYTYGTLGVQDYFEDCLDKDNKPFFKRTMKFSSPSAQTQFYFRAAMGNNPVLKSANEINLDSLQLRITSGHSAIIRKGSPGEVLISLTLPKGSTTLTLEYQW